MRTGHLPVAPVVTGFAHEAFFYRGEPGFLDGTVAFAREGVDRGEAVLVALASDRLARLEAALGRPPGVAYVDLSVLGRNPARILPAWRDFVAASGGRGAGLRGVAEPIWPGRRAAELDECRIHEGLLNVAFAGLAAQGATFRMLCAYDVSTLTRDVIEDARRNHPYVWEGGVPRVCTAYLDAGAGESALAGMLAEPVPGQVSDRLVFGPGDLGWARSMAERHGRSAGLRPERAEDLALAVHEVVTNSLVHGGGTGVLRIWREATAVVCEVADRGVLADPMVGRRTPAPGQESGRGLWLANQLCDLVQVRSRDGRTVVRLRMELFAAGVEHPPRARRPADPIG